MPNTKRVLVLHGYTQNATFFSNKLAALTKEAQDVEFVFLDGPHILHPVDPITTHHERNNLNNGSVSNSTRDLEERDPSKVPRGWWRHNSDFIRPVGVEDTIMMFKKVLQEERFDGILGFSQGAAFAIALSALLENPHIYPPFLVDGKAPHPLFKFCIAVSGFRLSHPLFDVIFQKPYSTPTLHIIGKHDIVVTEERSKFVVKSSSNCRVEQHDGGHFVPSKNAWPKFLAECIRKPFDEVPSPRTILALSILPSNPTTVFETTESRGLRTYL